MTSFINRIEYTPILLIIMIVDDEEVYVIIDNYIPKTLSKLIFHQ